MMFADELLLCAMTRGEVEEDLDTWIVVFERQGLTISKTQNKDSILAEQNIRLKWFGHCWRRESNHMGDILDKCPNGCNAD